MKALFVTGSLAHGGAERHAITLVNGLAERGHECHAAYVKDFQPNQLERVRAAASARCMHARGYLDRHALSALAARIDELRPSVVVAANPYAMMYAYLALRRSGVRAPFAGTFHSTMLRSAKEWLQMLYYRPLFWAADCLVFVCEAQRRHWLSRLVGARANFVIHNGIDVERWKPAPPEEVRAARAAHGYGERDYVVGICAVLRPEKNHEQLLDAIAALRSRGIAAQALVIGDGPRRAAIEAHARAAGVAQAVRITGYQQDVRPHLAACDAVVNCSTSETFSLASLEAMALARPMVHAALGGAAEMIRHAENGFLFPVGDTPALVACLARLAEPALRERLGAAARAQVVARFSERTMLERYETLFVNLETQWRTRENLRRSAPVH